MEISSRRSLVFAFFAAFSFSFGIGVGVRFRGGFGAGGGRGVGVKAFDDYVAEGYRGAVVLQADAALGRHLRVGGLEFVRRAVGVFAGVRPFGQVNVVGLLAVDGDLDGLAFGGDGEVIPFARLDFNLARGRGDVVDGADEVLVVGKPEGVNPSIATKSIQPLAPMVRVAFERGDRNNPHPVRTVDVEHRVGKMRVEVSAHWRKDRAVARRRSAYFGDDFVDGFAKTPS